MKTVSMKWNPALSAACAPKTMTIATAALLLLLPTTAEAAGSQGVQHHQMGLTGAITTVAGEAWNAIAAFASCFWSQSTTDKVRQVSVLLAFSSIASTAAPLIRVWNAVVAAKPLLDFRGRRIGSSKKYQEPMRALFLGFMFYSAFAFLTHLSDVVSPKVSLLQTILECAIQASLALLIFWQFRKIQVFAREAFGHDATKQGRFWTLINEALDTHKVNLRHVQQSAILLPFTVVTPKITDAVEGGSAIAPVVTSIAAAIHQLVSQLSATAF